MKQALQPDVSMLTIMSTRASHICLHLAHIPITFMRVQMSFKHCNLYLSLAAPLYPEKKTDFSYCLRLYGCVNRHKITSSTSNTPGK